MGKLGSIGRHKFFNGNLISRKRKFRDQNI
jgi:hypothetical protein